MDIFSCCGSLLSALGMFDKMKTLQYQQGTLQGKDWSFKHNHRTRIPA
jgi:hypothetical protein